MADIIVKQIIARPIQLADQIVKEADFACSFKQDCADIKSKTEKLGGLLRQAARASNDLYERPTRRIIDNTEQVLEKTLQLVVKCQANGFQRLFTIIPAAAVRRSSGQIDMSIGDVSWLLRVSSQPDDGREGDYVGLPPIASNEPILCLIWEQIAILCCGTHDDRADAAASLVSLARDNYRYGRSIIEEGGVPPLLKLAKEGRMEGQESAIRAIGLLGRDPESVEQIVKAGVCSVFAKILKGGHMKVQISVAWAVSELAANYPTCQDHFLQNNMIRLLVGHLAYETIEEHSKYAIPNKNNMSLIHAVVDANSAHGVRNLQDYDDRCHVARPAGLDSGETHHVMTNSATIKPGYSMKVSQTPPQQRREKSRRRVALPGASIKGREFEDPATKIEMKAMAARALWHLCAGNFSICKTVTESRALLCFAVLLEKGEDEVKYNSAMALMEITAVAERHAELRRSAFKPTSTTAREVLDKLLKIVNKGESDLLIPSIQSIGNLARTFRATETRLIPPLVRLLDEREAEVSAEASIALIKFACTDNYLHVTHCKSILEAGAPKHLIQLTYFGEQMAQLPGLILLCYIALHVPDSETLAQEDVLIVLQWALKQGHLMQDSSLETLVLEAKQRLEIYQLSRVH